MQVVNDTDFDGVHQLTAGLLSQLVTHPMQLIVAYCRCPRGNLLFNPFVAKSGVTKPVDQVRSQLTPKVVGSFYLSAIAVTTGVHKAEHKNCTYAFMLKGPRYDKLVDLACRDINAIIGVQLSQQIANENVSYCADFMRHYTPDTFILKNVHEVAAVDLISKDATTTVLDEDTRAFAAATMCTSVLYFIFPYKIYI